MHEEVAETLDVATTAIARASSHALERDCHKRDRILTMVDMLRTFGHVCSPIGRYHSAWKLDDDRSGRGRNVKRKVEE